MALSLSLLAFAASWLFLPGEDAGFDRYQLPKELCAAALSALALAAAARRRLALDAVNLTLAALLAACALATVLATSVPLALRGATLVLAAVSVFAAARRCDDVEAERVQRAVVLAAAGVALLALLEAFGVVAGITQTGRAPGASLGQRNAVAHLALLASPAAWTLSVSTRSRAGRGGGIAAAALLAAAIVVTRSRAAWVTAPVVIAVWAWVQRRPAPLLAAVAAAALVALAPAPLHWSTDRPYADTLGRIVDVERGSGRGRLTQYRATLELVKAHPLFGVGPSNWAVEYPTVSPAGDSTFRSDAWLATGRLLTSDWLALACEEGLLAAGAAAALALLLWRTPAARPVLVALLGVGALDSVLQLPATAMCAALLLGTSARDADARFAPRAAPVALAVLLAAAAVLAGARVVGLGYRLRGGTENFEQAVRWNGADLQARSALAETYLAEDGTCSRARPHVEALVRLLPHTPLVLEQARACGLTAPTERR